MPLLASSRQRFVAGRLVRHVSELLETHEMEMLVADCANRSTMDLFDLEP